MLTKAIEGAWTEMGAALADFGTRAGDSHGAPLRRSLEDPFTGLKSRIDRVAGYYKKGTCELVAAASGISKSTIDQAVIWSDQVRDSRNVLHFGKVPTVPINYERVAVLLLATTTNLRAMYAVQADAKLLP